MISGSSALTTGERMPRDPALPVAARARHLSDIALAHTRLGHDGAALDTLDTMVRLALSWARFQNQPKQIYRELRDRAANTERLVTLAARLGLRLR